MDVIWVVVVLLPWIVLSFWVFKFRNIFYFLIRIENTMASMDTILKDAGVVDPQVPIKNPQVEAKRQRIRNIVAAGQCEKFFGKKHTLAFVDKADEAVINKMFEIYESKYSSLVSDSILERFLDLTGKGVSYVAPIDDSRELSDDYKADFVITNELKRVTGQLAYMFGPVLALVSGGLITAKHIKWDELREKINFPMNNIVEEDVSRTADAADAADPDEPTTGTSCATGEGD